jgi:predicted permease
LLGRGFTADEDRPGGPAVVVISEALWGQLFARDPAAVGRTIRLNDVPRTIVGVLPAAADFGTLQILRGAAYGRGFADRGEAARVDVWLPLAADPATLPRETHPIFVLGRLRADGGVAAAQQELGAIAAELEETYPENDGRGVHVEALSRVVFGPARPALLVLLGAVALVLFIACANVANLLLVRGTARLREVTVRLALGASARRLARQFLVESAVLTLAGAAGGVLLALFGIDLLRLLAPATLPRVAAVGIDTRVLGVTVAVSVLVALAFGLLPLLQARRMDLQPALQGVAGRGASGGREQRRFRSVLVITELALAVMLMIGAGLLIRTLWRLQRVDPGFDAAGVLKLEYQLPASRYPRDFAQWPRWPETRAFNDELRRRVAALPGVSSVAIAANHPLAAGYTSSIAVVGRESEAGDWPEPAIRMVAAGYLEILGVPLVSGRGFTASDDVDAAAVIAVNEAGRRRFFGGADPVGQRIRLWGAERLVVGVVGNEHVHGIAAASPPAVYLPLEQVPVANGGYTLLVRAAGDPTTLIPAVRRVVRELDAGLPLFGIEPLTSTVTASIGQQRFTMTVLVVFATVAMILAVVGVHGVLSYSVSQRTREIGVRMALGADGRTVRSLVLGEGARLTAGGVGVGLLGALVLTRVLTTLLYGVGPVDPPTFAGVALLLGGVAILASLAPARRAARVDPIAVLRTE